MESQNDQPTFEQIQADQALFDFVVGEMQSGADQASVSQKLIEQGFDKEKAPEMTSALFAKIIEQVKKEKYTGSTTIQAAIGGLIAAVIAGVIWGYIVIWTGYEIGYVAIGVGFLTGVGVVIGAKEEKGLPLQLLSAISAFLGILIGKYITFFHFLKEEAALAYGPEVAAQMDILSKASIEFFIDFIPALASGFDALWILLAVWVAWVIPKPLGVDMSAYRHLHLDSNI